MKASRIAERVASSFVKDLPMTADEMEGYCHDCADQIRTGELQVTWGELEEILRDYEADRGI